MQRIYKSLSCLTLYISVEGGVTSLRPMLKSTFEICKDHDREYIIQILKECDKNHREDDTSKSNEARILPGKCRNFLLKSAKCSKFLSNSNDKTLNYNDTISKQKLKITTFVSFKQIPTCVPSKPSN